MKVCKFEKMKEEDEIRQVINYILKEHPYVVVVPTLTQLQEWLQDISISWFHEEESNISDIMPIINIDKRINLKDISIEEAKSLELLEPFGEANKMPIFLIQNLKIDSIRALSDGKHLKLTLKQDNYIIDAIGFNMGELSKQYLLGDKVDVVGTIEINTFGNKENIQMNLKDIRKAM